MLIPERNEADLDEVPNEIKNDLEFVAVSKMDHLSRIDRAERRRSRPRAHDAACGGGLPNDVVLGRRTR
ncbi:ATP-dependent protease La [Labilithrix luteola]|uniref:ATP-dependent protease La n=1 Tax=Labilithrix luteola TaxID=1391654 RepID=A0A0K1Q7G4_9BACT|nr:ATP-dependent protease La [Labilithrix luteola]